MPEYLIIGAQKCGTSSLYKYLVQHPRIVRATTKEVGFFDKSFHKGIPWYEDQFRYGPLWRRLFGLKAGEATPEYLFNPIVPKRVFDSYPNIKLIALIRDPVERAYSHYQHMVRHHGETRDFWEALDAELKMDSEVTHREDLLSGNLESLGYRYQGRGIYIDQIQRWHSVFPSEQLLVLFFEDFIKYPAEATHNVTDFLGLKPHIVNTGRVHNSGGQYEPMKPETRERLIDFFSPHDRRLSEYLGRELPWG